MRFSVVAFSATVVSLGALSSVPASAAEGQWHLGGGLGAASFARTDSGFGPALGVQAAYELSDMFDIHLEFSASQHSFVEGINTRFYGANAGFIYKVDVIEWVPYLGLYAGVFRFDGDVIPAPLQRTELGIGVPLGLDYSFSRSFAVGAQGRYHGFMSDPMDSIGDAPYFLALLRAEYRWGW
ncbi:MAG TPA: outer membrane beta-barrel protein [Polyangiaceae bacterium]|nr:outer membrane beta-barrel protein [Polyangiaceae bacterium]